ncbi:MAG: hypothetical protein ACLULL_06115 [Parabacteroides distasonis]
MSPTVPERRKSVAVAHRRLYWAKRANGRMAPSISGVTYALLKKSSRHAHRIVFPLFSIGLIDCEWCKRGYCVLSDIPHHIMSARASVCHGLVTASGRISRTENSMKRVKEEIRMPHCVRLFRGS